MNYCAEKGAVRTVDETADLSEAVQIYHCDSVDNSAMMMMREARIVD